MDGSTFKDKENLSSASEEELLRRGRRGSREAFQELVLLYGERAYRTAFALLGHREDAEEAVQDAFLKAFRHFRNFKGQSSFYTWFYRILSRTCYERVRSKGRRVMRHAISLDAPAAEPSDGASEAPLLDSLRDSGANPREASIRREDELRLKRALRYLDQEDYEIISMRSVEGFSYEAIAAALGCPLGTVMSRLYRARLHLKEFLQKGQTPFWNKEEKETSN